jgi:hypothetical protein
MLHHKTINTISHIERGRSAGMDDVGEQATRIRIALNFTVARKTFFRRINRAKFSLWLCGAY